VADEGGVSGEHNATLGALAREGYLLARQELRWAGAWAVLDHGDVDEDHNVVPSLHRSEFVLKRELLSYLVEVLMRWRLVG
jgi:hypothetical protein